MTTTIELLDSDEAARVLDVTPGTLSVWRATRRYALKFVKVGRKVRYRRQDLLDFLDSRTHSGTGITEPTPKGSPRREAP